MPRLTEEEIAQRREGIGSSDVPAILGISPHANRWDVFNEKIGLGSGFEGSEQTEIGHDLEPWIAQWYERSTGNQLVPGGHLVHPQQAWARATIDFRIMGRSLSLECKNVGLGQAREWDDSIEDGVPHHVRAQAVWQAGVGGIEAVDVAAFLGGTKRRVFRVPFDRELFDLMIDTCGIFWAAVQAGEPPDIDGSEGARRYLASKWPVATEVIAPCEDAEADAMAAQYFEAHAMTKRGEVAKEIANQHMIQRVGELAGLERQGHWRFTFKGKEGKRRVKWTDLRKGEE